MGLERPRQRVTLAEVARCAGVAESTASRVMNGYTRNFRVRDEVRQRVLDAARELGYEPNPMVRSIAAKRTNLVAAVGSPHVGQGGEALRAAATRLLEERVHVCTAFVSPERREVGIPSWRVDGVLAVRAAGLDELREYAGEGSVCVSMDGPVLDDADAVNPDEDHAVRLGHAHLIESGRSGVVYAVMDPGAENRHEARSCARQQAAYVRLCAELGDDPRIIDLGRDSPRPELAELLGAIDAPGVLVPDVLSAMRLIQLAAAVGLRVPDGLGVVCLRDEPSCAYVTPALTSVRHSPEALGVRAAEMLLDRLRAEPVPRAGVRHELVRGELIVRSSCAITQRV